MKGLKKIAYTKVIPTLGRLLKKRNKYINVVYYHDIVDEGEGVSFMRTPYSVFKEQMEHIASRSLPTFRFDDLTNEKCRELAGKGVLITFDDGWKSNYNKIFQLMQELGLRYNIFLEVEKIGKDPDYLSWDEVREMHKSGLVGFGAHTYTHADMSDLSKVDLDLEIKGANKKIKDETGIEVKDFCFPYGACTKESIACIENEKVYDRIYTSNLDYTYPQGDSLIFGRNGINCEESFSVFKDKLAGNFNIFTTLGRWIKR